MERRRDRSEASDRFTQSWLIAVDIAQLMLPNRIQLCLQGGNKWIRVLRPKNPLPVGQSTSSRQIWIGSHLSSKASRSRSSTSGRKWASLLACSNGSLGQNSHSTNIQNLNRVSSWKDRFTITASAVPVNSSGGRCPDRKTIPPRRNSVQCL